MGFLTTVILGLAAILFAIYCILPSPLKPKGNMESDEGFSRDKNDQNRSIEALEEDDWYGILELKDDASGEEIKISFRRLSRIHHPDKNLNDQEGATRRFAKVSRAYETLSDEASRAQYDYLKNLKKSEPAAATAQGPQSGTSWGWFWPSTSSESAPRSHVHDGDGCPGCVFRDRWGICDIHLQIFYHPNLYRGMDDDPPGFFALYRWAFDKLIVEDECKFTDRNQSSFPSFGYSNWPYNGSAVKLPKNKKKGRGPRLVKKDAKTFYDFWTTFSSRKNFGWAKVEAVGVPDPALKRFIQKENKKLQDAARNEYNQTVRNLAKHIRKIDPRCR